MSATIVLPDHVTASRELLRGNATRVHAPVAAYVTELRTVYILAEGWIETFLPDITQLPRNGIRIEAAGGYGPLGQPPGYLHRRVQFHCVGESRDAARKIAMLVGLIFMPTRRNMQGFMAAGTRISQTLEVTGPVPGVDIDSRASKGEIHYQIMTVGLQMIEVGVDG